MGFASYIPCCPSLSPEEGGSEAPNRGQEGREGCVRTFASCCWRSWCGISSVRWLQSSLLGYIPTGYGMVQSFSREWETQDFPSKGVVTLRFWMGRRDIGVLYRDSCMRFWVLVMCYPEMRSSLFCVVFFVLGTPMNLAERCYSEMRSSLLWVVLYVLATPISLAGRCAIQRCIQHGVFAFWLCRWTELGDIQHLEMLVIDVHTIFRGLLSWANWFETSLRSCEKFRRGLELFCEGFALIIVEFVHWFIARSLTGSPWNVLGFLPYDDWSHHWSEDESRCCWETAVDGRKPSYIGD